MVVIAACRAAIWCVQFVFSGHKFCRTHQIALCLTFRGTECHLVPPLAANAQLQGDPPPVFQHKLTLVTSCNDCSLPTLLGRGRTLAHLCKPQSKYMDAVVLATPLCLQASLA